MLPFEKAFPILCAQNTSSMRYFIGIAAIVLTSCTAQRELTQIPAQNSQEYLVAATLYVQKSAEYEALCLQAYAQAEAQLLEYFENGGGKPAVVLDLDETVLDNSAYTAWQILADRPYDDDTWNQWVEDASAPAVPGAVRFLNIADSLGAELYYISNRDVSGLEATIRNMADLGINRVEEDRFFLKTTTSDKTGRRKDVMDTGWNLIMLIGDNLGDFDRIWDKPAPLEDRSKMVANRRAQFGTVFIVLPNPLYGTWLQAIYGYEHMDEDAQRETRRKALEAWEGPE